MYEDPSRYFDELARQEREPEIRRTFYEEVPKLLKEIAQLLRERPNVEAFRPGECGPR